MKSLGKNIAEKRKLLHMTQEDLADKLGVTSQAVSKWENDISIPDITLLIELADLFNITLDELVRNKEPETKLVAQEIRKPVDKMVLKIIVDCADGDKVKLNLPISLVRMWLSLSAEKSVKIGDIDLSNIDFDHVIEMASQGVVGKLLEIESDGDIVEIYIQ